MDSSNSASVSRLYEELLGFFIFPPRIFFHFSTLLSRKSDRQNKISRVARGGATRGGTRNTKRVDLNFSFGSEAQNTANINEMPQYNTAHRHFREESSTVCDPLCYTGMPFSLHCASQCNTKVSFTNCIHECVISRSTAVVPPVDLRSPSRLRFRRNSP